MKTRTKKLTCKPCQQVSRHHFMIQTELYKSVLAQRIIQLKTSVANMTQVYCHDSLPRLTKYLSGDKAGDRCASELWSCASRATNTGSKTSMMQPSGRYPSSSALSKLPVACLKMVSCRFMSCEHHHPARRVHLHLGIIVRMHLKFAPRGSTLQLACIHCILKQSVPVISCPVNNYMQQICQEVFMYTLCTAIYTLLQLGQYVGSMLAEIHA